MVPYLLVFMIPSILALQFRRHLTLKAWALVFVVFALFIGLRYQVGPDWTQYSAIHYMTGNQSLLDIALRSEPLSHLLFWISENSGTHMALSNLVGASILLGGVFAFALRTSNPWLAIVNATPYFVFVMGMSGVRQAAAAGIMLYLLAHWRRFTFVKRIGTIFIAAMFHTSALVNSIFLITQMHIPFRYKIVLSGLVLGATFALGTEIPMFAEGMMVYQERYLENPEDVRSPGSIYHISLIAIPALLGFIYRRQILPYIDNKQLFYFGIQAAIAVILINFYSTTVASRLTIYLYFIPMMIFPALTHLQGEQGRRFFTQLVVAYNFLVMVIWFNFSNLHVAYIPYQSLLLQG